VKHARFLDEHASPIPLLNHVVGPIMNWIYQVLSFFVAFGPVILGTVLWHFIWSDDSDSSGGPPGGPNWQPTPPSPSFSGDRLPQHDRPVHSPTMPTREEA